MTAIEQAINVAGGQIKLAAISGVTQQTVSSWKRKGYVEENFILTVYKAVKNVVPIELFHEDLHTYQKPRCEPISKVNRRIKYNIKRLSILQSKGGDVIEWLGSLVNEHPEQRQIFKDLAAHEQAAIKLRQRYIKELTRVIQSN